ncbi:MAG: hypothetical protein GX031_11485 [Candidatus Riflebacteria bacterium]|nr:hypothetical protein [Candidatus Riflebacteria bacterium]
MTTGIAYYVDGINNLYRNKVNLCELVFKDRALLQILHGRLSHINSVSDFVLILPDTFVTQDISESAANLGIKIRTFDLSKMVEKPMFLQQQHWDTENDSGCDTLLGQPFAALVEEFGFDTLIVVPLCNILVESEAVIESIRLHKREAFDFTEICDRVPGAAWHVFDGNLLLGLEKSHPDLMRVRGALSWMLFKPLYPFKKGSCHCPRIKPSLNVDLRINSERSVYTFSNTVKDIDEFSGPEFSYEKWLKNSNWEEKYTEYGPKNIVIEPSNYCRASCLGCPHPKMTRNREHMSQEVFSKIASSFVPGDDCKWIFSGMGEPLLNPFISSMAKESAKYNSVLITSMQTNFPEDFSFRSLNQIRISVDSCTPEEFEKNRSGCVWKNIKEFLMFVKKRRESNLEFPDIGVTLVRHEKTEKNIQNFIGYYKQAVKPVFNDYYFVWPFEHIRSEVSWYQVLGESSYNNILKKTCTVDFEPVKRRVCRNSALSLYVLSNGAVTFCPYDFEGQYALGNVKENSLKEIWNLDSARSLRNNNSMPKPCVDCHDWYHYL